MPVPKRKRSRARRDKRFANKGLKPAIFGLCKQCDEPLLPHVVCAGCGYYQGRKVMVSKSERFAKRADERKVLADRQTALQEKAAAIAAPQEQ